MRLSSFALTIVAAGSLALAACNRESEAPAPSTARPADSTHSTTQAMDDAGITTRVKTALIAESQLNSRGIDVDTRDGIVTLSGSVPDKAQSDRAAQVAQGIGGVRRVENRLSVSGS
jgi:hyperosmotically inducible protein